MDITWKPTRIAVTVLVKCEDKYALIKRPDTETRWPGYWTIPGGKAQTTDYAKTPYYGVLENTAYRELLEETGISKTDIGPLTYVCSVALPDSLIVSFTSTLKHSYIDRPKFSFEGEQGGWYTAEQASKLQLIAKIYDEILLVEGK